MNDLKKLKRRAGLLEAEEYIGPDDADDMRTAEHDAQMDREKKIERIIAQTFIRLGLPIEISISYKGKRVPQGIYYSEDDNREARVTLDDSEIDLRLLAPLLTSGLGDNFKVSGGDQISIVFNVDPNLDHVVER